MTTAIPTMFGSPAAQPGIQLRPRQTDALTTIFQRLNAGVRKQLIALPTGVGKTVLGVHVANHFQRTLFLVPRQELLEQAITTFNAALPGEPLGIIWGRKSDHHARFNIGMIQTVHARLGRIPADQFDLVIVDEAHHAGAKTWRTTLDHFTPKLRLGLSATPERADGVPLSNLFDEISYEMTIRDAVLEGYLVKPIGIQIRTDTELDEVHTVAGDFNQGELAATVDTPGRNHLVVDKYQGHAAGRRAVVFCVSIAHAQNIAKAFQDAGINADWVSGDDNDRETKIAKLKRGDLQILCNAMILTEGFDSPEISAVLMARPTKSKPLYIQCAGRGLRLAPNKSDCIIMDFADNTRRHRLVTAWDFIGRRMNQQDAGKAVDLVSRNPLEQKLGEAGADTAQALFEELFDDSMRLDAFAEMVDLLEPAPAEPTFNYGKKEWHYAQPTPAQLKTLRQLGYDVDTADFTRGQASVMLSRVPAPKPALRQLFLYGFDTLSQEWTVDQANAALKAAARKGLKPNWQRVQQLAGGTA